MANVQPGEVKRKILINIEGSWGEITQFVIGDISGEWGLNGNSPTDRIAETGILYFSLNNESGNFTPDSVNSLYGWKKGTPIKLVVCYQNEEYIRFYGRVDEIDIESSLGDIERVNVRAVDWMDYANKYPLNTPNIQIKKRGDEIINTIVTSMPIQPIENSYDVGENGFPSTFDSTGSKTKALTEIQKVALSELGQVYLQKSRLSGEKLVFESATHRNGLSDLSILPVDIDLCEKLVTQTGEELVTQDGESFVLNDYTTFTCDDEMTDSKTTYGKNMINQVKVKAYPKKVDTTLQVLFSLDSPLLVPSSSTITFEGNFSDPTGGSEVNGINLQAPLATTDFLMNTMEDGSGTNITASLVISATYSSKGVKYTLQNNNVEAGYITKLQVRGYGIYAYNPIEKTVSANSSINNFGYVEETIDQKLQTSLTQGFITSKQILEKHKDPRTVLESIDLLANTSETLLQAFLWMDIGSKIGIKESKKGIDGHYYISHIEFNITPGGVIHYSWKVTESLSLQKGLDKIALHFTDDTKQAINFGYLPKLCNFKKRTYMSWIKMDAELGGGRNIISINSDFAGTILYLITGGKVSVYSRNSIGPGKWETTDSWWTPGVWCHVAMTKDVTTDPLAYPKIYFNGIVRPVTQTNPPVGTYRDETGCLLVLGNVKTATIDYADPLGGSLYDTRMYDRILSADEIYDIYLGNENNNGLVFQSPCVRTRDLWKYELQTLNSDLPVLDNIYGYVGDVIESPTCVPYP